MFDRSILDALVVQPNGRVPVAPYPGLHWLTFPQAAFHDTDSEQFVRISRAPKLRGDSGFKFWIAAEVAGGQNGRHIAGAYLHQARFETLTELEFNRRVAEATRGLLAPLSLPLHAPSGFVGALKMEDMETELTVSLVAEYADEFIHFFWESTA